MENTPPVVNEQVLTTPAVREDAKPQEVVPEVPVVTPETPPSLPGDKTPNHLLLKSLQEEREKNRQLEEALKNLTTTTPKSDEEEVYSDEGKVILSKVSTLEAELSALKEEKELEVLLHQYPLLREKQDDFKEFRKNEHPRAKLESVAKLFLAENDLLEPTRKGLEKPTGGDKVPYSSGMSAEDASTLRKTNFKKYQELLMKGQIKIEK